TVGGLIIDILGEIPDDDSDEKIVVTYENYEFEVVNVRDRRIERIIMTIKPKSETNEDDSKEEKQESK
ncbi:transporter associated domain-containing protein, partial [Acinetobacter baumannii]|nr:transporter associated domain-containing protein [Acinetobacter baumannii]